MYNLLVGLEGGSVTEDRLLEYTEDGIRTRLRSSLRESLELLPALSLPETGDASSEQVARVGKISNIRRHGREYRFLFTPNPKIAPIPTSQILDAAEELGIGLGSGEFKRTHWAVKEVNLLEVLLEQREQTQRERETGFLAGAAQFPTSEPRDPTLVAVMMPFESSFDVVYETIELAVTDAGLRCERADNIWEHDHVMADVLSLIWRSQVVVADLTGKNSNVFYETGLAHALPRHTVLLTQNKGDVPFDLQSIRYLHYGLGTSERLSLRGQLAKRLQTLVSRE